MSQLWACYYADNVDRFRRLLSLTGHSAQAAAVWNANAAGIGSSAGSLDSGDGGLATSPRVSGGGNKGTARKVSGGHHLNYYHNRSHHGGGGGGGGSSKAGGSSGMLSKNEVNSRDHAGLTILLRAAASTAGNALAFVQALLEHPAIDIYVQDTESGWNALHRALYAGNIAIARLLLEKERMVLAGQTLGAPLGRRIGLLIKTKDHEGNSPFDLYNSTIGERVLGALTDGDAPTTSDEDGEDESDSDVNDDPQHRTRPAKNAGGLQALVDGEDLFFFGSNKNLTLGLGDGDDRQFPERVYLQRPDDLLHRFYEEHLEAAAQARNKDASSAPPDESTAAMAPHDIAEIPALVQGRPLLVHDVVLSKLHSAVLTRDPVSNLYVCGIGRGGRLGLGDENTRFSFVPVQGPLADKHVTQVALGQNHTMAVTEGGELWTWGSNTSAQLGYTVAPPSTSTMTSLSLSSSAAKKPDSEPASLTPRQIFGTLRKERILGVAASALHSVAHTGSSLYCWGRNVGQLALMDADSRSLDMQVVPRRVAASLFSAPIVAVSAIDKATTCLLANHTVCVFTSYGYNMVKFPFAEVGMGIGLGMGRRARFDAGGGPNQISHIASGGETIVAVTSRGDLFTMNLVSDAGSSSSGGGSTSTTNPSKIRSALTPPRCIWNARKDGVRSVGVGEQGSVIISTHSGAVWRRVKRAKAKDVHGSGGSSSGNGNGPSKKDYKFHRVPFISNVSTVRSSAFGAFAAVRCDSQVIKQQIAVCEQTLWGDMKPLNVLQGFAAQNSPGSGDASLRFWDASTMRQQLGPVAHEILRSADLVADLARHLDTSSAAPLSDFGAVVCTSLEPSIRIPVHSWLLAGRSSALRDALAQWRAGGTAAVEVPNVCVIESKDGVTAVLTFAGLDLLSLLNLVMFLYEDRVVPAWNYVRQALPSAERYRQVRVEVMRVAAKLQMAALERAVRVQIAPKRTLDADLRAAIADPRFFEDGDTILELAKGAEARVHSAFLCRRCPWFQGLFHGRSDGQWLAARRQKQQQQQQQQNQKRPSPLRLDLQHVGVQAFGFVLRHLYADTGSELFDELLATSLDGFFDVVLEVLGIADELMLDRLGQVCQLVVGRFANTRNIAPLLNTISPCTVRAFRDAGLEYVCLQIETMLENHLLDDLDADMLQELGTVVRDNQLTQMPFARSGRAEALLLERYPDLAQDMDEERQRRVREMAFRSGAAAAAAAASTATISGAAFAVQGEDRRRPSSSLPLVSSSPSAHKNKNRAAGMGGRISGSGAADSLDDLAASPKPDSGTRRKSKGRLVANSEPFSPVLRPKASQADLMFDMDEDGDLQAPGPSHTNDGDMGQEASPLRPRPGVFRTSGAVASKMVSSGPSTGPSTGNSNPWGSPAAVRTASKLDLRTIMTESTEEVPLDSPDWIEVSASGSRAAQSSLSTSLAEAQQQQQQQQLKQGRLGDLSNTPPVAKMLTPARLSQKERKKQQQQQQQLQQQQQQLQQQLQQQQAASAASMAKQKGVAWGEPRRESSDSQQHQKQASNLAGPTSATGAASASASASASAGAAVAPMDDPQKAAVKRAHAGPRAASPDTRFAGQARQRSMQGPGPAGGRGSSGAGTGSSGNGSGSTGPLVPHSKVYIQPPPKAEPLLGLSMADIIVQQQLEQEQIREAVAKRSLEEIQQEQAFQEWWDQESRRTQEEEAQRDVREQTRSRGGGGGAGGGAGGGGRGGRGREKKKEREHQGGTEKTPRKGGRTGNKMRGHGHSDRGRRGGSGVGVEGIRAASKA